MDRQTTLERLISLEAEAAQLRKILDKQEKETALLPFPSKGSSEQVYYLSESENGKIGVSSTEAKNVSQNHANVFLSRETASRYAMAIDTFLLLRKSEGSTSTRDKLAQWMVEYDVSENKVMVARRFVANSKVSRLSPSFDSEENADKAVKAIGKDKLIEMFKTFHHLS